jgi:hypothetical protein
VSYAPYVRVVFVTVRAQISQGPPRFF